MPESSKTTLYELAARLAAGGENSVHQRYPNQKHFLLVLPEDSGPPPVVWTSSNPKIIEGNTSITKLSLKESLKNYNVPGAVIQPLQKTSRNNFKQIIVGRDEIADIRLNSQNVSKSHSAFEIKENKVHIRDLDSRNGTYVNEAQFSDPIELTSFTEIKFADVRTLYLSFTDLLELLKISTKVVLS